jgi:hypothetical protein
MSATRLTPAEANARLPLVSAVAADAADLASRLGAAESAYRGERQRPLPSQVRLNETAVEMRRLRTGLTACAAELASVGATGASSASEAVQGWVDFAGDLHGVSVVLCWKLGEERVDHFHREGDPHETRRPLPVPVHAG